VIAAVHRDHLVALAGRRRIATSIAVFGKTEASLALSRALSRTAGIPLYEIRGCV